MFGRNWSLNESPSEKEGKSNTFSASTNSSSTLNESPSEKEGKSVAKYFAGSAIRPQ